MYMLALVLSAERRELRVSMTRDCDRPVLIDATTQIRSDAQLMMVRFWPNTVRFSSA